MVPTHERPLLARVICDKAVAKANCPSKYNIAANETLGIPGNADSWKSARVMSSAAASKKHLLHALHDFSIGTNQFRYKRNPPKRPRMLGYKFAEIVLSHITYSPRNSSKSSTSLSLRASRTKSAPTFMVSVAVPEVFSPSVSAFETASLCCADLAGGAKSELKFTKFCLNKFEIPSRLAGSSR